MMRILRSRRSSSQERSETQPQRRNLEFRKEHWHKARLGEIDTGSGTRDPEESLNLAQQLQAANKRIQELEKKNRELEELNGFLRKHQLFSPRAVGSRERRTVKIHRYKD